MGKGKSHIVYGLITGVVLVIMSLIFQLTGIVDNPKMVWIGLISIIPFFVGLLLNANVYAKENDYIVTYGNIFWSCFRACMVIAIIGVAWSLLQMVLMPEIKEKAIQKTLESMQKKNMSDDQIEMGMKMTRKLYAVFLIFGIILGDLIIGAICSLIAAAIPKRKPVNPFDKV